MPESIEYNAGIIGRIFEPCYKSLHAYKIINCIKDRYTLIEQSLTVMQKSGADCSIRIGSSFQQSKDL